MWNPFSKRHARPADEDTTMAINRLADDIIILNSRKESAISSFRRTANELGSINEQLSSRNQFYDSLVEIVIDQKRQTEKMMSDNDNVRKKILEIIGEED